MVADLHSVSFGLVVPGTVTGDEYDVSGYDSVEYFARTGTAVAGSAATASVYIDVKDIDGNWFNGAGTLASIGSSSSKIAARGRGMNVGAADPMPMGVAQRIRTVVTGGTVEFGLNVIGF